MTTEDAKRSLRYLALQAGMSDEGLDDHVDVVIRKGLRELWYKRFWRFRADEYELTVTATDSWFALPNWVAAIRGMKEEGSPHGARIWFAKKETFDGIVARPSAFGQGYPRIFTIKRDFESEILSVKFFPIPSVTTIYCDVFRHAPDVVEKVPAIAESALDACMEKHLYTKKPEFTLAWKHAQDNVEREVLELERVDKPFGGAIMRSFDPSVLQEAAAVFPRRPWE